MDVKEYEPHSFRTSVNQNVLGCGSYAKVLCCKHNDLGVVAVKCSNITGSSENDVEQKEEARKRVKIMLSLKHENIIAVFGMILLPYRFGIVMELAQLGNLHDLLFQKKFVDRIEITWIMKVKFFDNIACGLDYLHNNDKKKTLIHKDLKSENILIASGMILKIADFGSFDIKVATGAITITNIKPNKQHTPYYAAPEFLRSMVGCDSDVDFIPSRAMDVYSYSMIGYEIITRQKIFDKVSNYDLIISLIIERGQKPNPKFVDDSEPNEVSCNLDKCIFSLLKSVMERCWNFNPSLRPTIAKVKSDISDLKNDICDYQKTAANHAHILEEMLKTVKWDESSETGSSSSDKEIDLLTYFHPVFSSRNFEMMKKESAGNLLLSSETSGLKQVQSEVKKKLKSSSEKMPDSTIFSKHGSDEKKFADETFASQKVEAKLLSLPFSTNQYPDEEENNPWSNYVFSQDYNMNHKERGIFLIFNQERFSIDHVPSRPGSTADANRFSHVARFMGFEYIRIFHNLTKREIFDWLFVISRADNSNYDCFGCVILTNGIENDELFASDETFHLNEILSFFTTESCPDLAGKPKMFFVNACRGSSLGPKASTVSPYVDYFKSPLSPALHYAQSPEFPFSLAMDEKDAAVVARSFEQSQQPYPHLVDFIIAFSTVPGYASWRNSEHGSWFAQSAYHCFEKFIKTHDLVRILTKVNKMLSKSFASRSRLGDRHKQHSSIVSYLTDELYFCKRD